MPPLGIEPWSSAWQSGVQIDFEAFEEWLCKDHKRRVARCMSNYARKFQHCLLKRDLSEVRDLRDTLRPNVMKALSALAKYLGIHQEYKRLIKSYALKWGGKSADDIIIDRLTKVVKPGEIFKWIRQVKIARPELNIFMDFIAITGLRLIEAYTSYNLIIELARKDKLHEYYNAEKGTLEHFRFKELFIRKNKKAFLSFVPASMIKNIAENHLLKSAEGIIKRVRSEGLHSRFGDVREAHGTFLSKYLKSPEIDFLHGRVSANVFMKNYFNPALIADLKTRAFKGIQAIQKKI